MNLYLVRHAVAFDRDPDRWPDDSRRPLTPEGEKDFRTAARGLGKIVPNMRVLLSSPYSRAWRTAEILAGLNGWPEPKNLPALEPEAPPEEVARALEPFSEAESVALVGHRPCLHELAAYLLTGDTAGAEIKIKKGGALRITFDGPLEPGSGRLHWLFTPKVLRGLQDLS